MAKYGKGGLDEMFGDAWDVAGGFGAGMVRGREGWMC